MNNEIEVSIICNTFNQKNYIADALKSFVEQKTNFKFEILVHDDASTDGTVEIVKEFELKYPELIKPIYQIENQYSQGIPITETFQYPRVRGRYIAFCEGDDYWIDSNKLQKQYEAMEAHPELDMCAHGAIYIDGRSGEELQVYNISDCECIYTPEQVIIGDGSFIPTASLFYRSILIHEKYAFLNILSLDYAWQIHGSLRGGLLYLPNVMSVYRVDATNSWSLRIKSDIRYRWGFYKKVRKMLHVLNKETKYLYWKAILRVDLRYLVNNTYGMVKCYIKHGINIQGDANGN